MTKNSPLDHLAQSEAALTGEDSISGADEGVLRSYPAAPEGIRLVVHSAFADYAVGDQITDPAAMAEVLAVNPHFVTKAAAQVPETDAAVSGI